MKFSSPAWCGHGTTLLFKEIRHINGNSSTELQRLQDTKCAICKSNKNLQKFKDV